MRRAAGDALSTTHMDVPRKKWGVCMFFF
jgi:hypothetical protein